MGKPYFEFASANKFELLLEGEIKPMERAHSRRKSGDRRVDSPSARVYAEGVLFRDIIFVLRMSFVIAMELPGFEEKVQKVAISFSSHNWSVSSSGLSCVRKHAYWWPIMIWAM